jgi:hypothetical protein
MKTQQFLLLIFHIFLVACTQIVTVTDEGPQHTNSEGVAAITKQPPTVTNLPPKTLVPTQRLTIEAVQTPSPTGFPTPIPIDPARYEAWWTYTNPIYGFSFRLPNDWVLTETTTGNPMMNGHLLNIHPQDTNGNLNIRFTFRRIGEDVFLWPTGVGSGAFISHGFIDIDEKPARRMLFVCPTGQIQSIWYQGETEPNIQRGDLEFGFIFGYTEVYCEEGYSLGGKEQHIGEMIIASLQNP